MKDTVLQKVEQFVAEFILEHSLILLYWMMIIRYDSGRITSMSVVLWGVAASTGILFVTKLTSDILFFGWKAHSGCQRRSVKRLLQVLTFFVSAGASYCGWTIFSIAIDCYISSRSMVLLCLVSAVGTNALNLAVKSTLNILLPAFRNSRLRVWLHEMLDDSRDDNGTDL